MTRYQHMIPVRDDEPDYHEEEVKPHPLDRRFCYYCDKKIMVVDENEGPESLKALLRF